MILRFFLVGLVIAIGGCASLPIEGLPCPCISGWQCCAVSNVCVVEGDSCPNAASWRQEDLGTISVSLWGVWGSGPQDIYAVGSGIILHSTGNGVWLPQTLPSMVNQSSLNLFDVWGRSADDIYAVGQDGTILHSSGDRTWLAQHSGTNRALYGVWGTENGDVYAVGAQGTILHSSGADDWTPQNSGTTYDLNGLSGTGPAELFVAGAIGPADATVFRSEGTGSWTPESVSPSQPIQDIYVTSPDDVYVVGGADTHNGVIFHWSRTSLAWDRDAEPPVEMSSVWGNPFDLYAVGAAGTILHSRAGAEQGWFAQSSGSRSALAAVWGSGSADVYAVGIGATILHFH